MKAYSFLFLLLALGFSLACKSGEGTGGSDSSSTSTPVVEDDSATETSSGVFTSTTRNYKIESRGSVVGTIVLTNDSGSSIAVVPSVIDGPTYVDMTAGTFVSGETFTLTSGNSRTFEVSDNVSMSLSNGDHAEAGMSFVINGTDTIVGNCNYIYSTEKLVSASTLALRDNAVLLNGEGLVLRTLLQIGNVDGQYIAPAGGNITFSGTPSELTTSITSVHAVVSQGVINPIITTIPNVSFSGFDNDMKLSYFFSDPVFFGDYPQLSVDFYINLGSGFDDFQEDGVSFVPSILDGDLYLTNEYGDLISDEASMSSLVGPTISLTPYGISLSGNSSVASGQHTVSDTVFQKVFAMNVTLDSSFTASIDELVFSTNDPDTLNVVALYLDDLPVTYESGVQAAVIPTSDGNITFKGDLNLTFDENSEISLYATSTLAGDGATDTANLESPVTITYVPGSIVVTEYATQGVVAVDESGYSSTDDLSTVYYYESVPALSVTTDSSGLPVLSIDTNGSTENVYITSVDTNFAIDNAAASIDLSALDFPVGGISTSSTNTVSQASPGATLTLDSDLLVSDQGGTLTQAMLDDIADDLNVTGGVSVTITGASFYLESDPSDIKTLIGFESQPIEIQD